MGQAYPVSASSKLCTFINIFLELLRSMVLPVSGATWAAATFLCCCLVEHSAEQHRNVCFLRTPKNL